MDTMFVQLLVLVSNAELFMPLSSGDCNDCNENQHRIRPVVSR